MNFLRDFFSGVYGCNREERDMTNNREYLELAAKADPTSSRRKRYFYAAGPRLIEMGAKA